MEGNAYTIPQISQQSNELKEVWQSLDTYEIKTKYGSVVDAQKYIDKIQSYNKKTNLLNDVIDDKSFCKKQDTQCIKGNLAFGGR